MGCGSGNRLLFFATSFSSLPIRLPHTSPAPTTAHLDPSPLLNKKSTTFPRANGTCE